VSTHVEMHSESNHKVITF